MKMLLRFFLSACWILLLSNVLSGIWVDGIVSAIVVAFILSVLNTIVKPVLQILTLPLTILTLGIWLFLLNVGMVYLTAYFVDGFKVTSFISAIFFSLLMIFGSSVLGAIFPDKKKDDKKNR